MRKLAYAFTAAAAIAIGVPTIANAGGIGVYVDGDHGYYGDRYEGPRARFYEHRDREFYRHGYYHRYGDRDVIIRHHHWDYD